MSKKLLKSFVAAAAMVCVLSTGIVALAAGNYTVQTGDYLSKISRQAYGTAEQWRAIYEANKSAIKDPNVIYAGQVFVIPDLPGTGSGNAAAADTAAANSPAAEAPAAGETPAVPSEAAAPAPAADTAQAAAPAKNVPVGANPAEDPPGYHVYYGTDGDWIRVGGGPQYMVDVTGTYGVTYREYMPGANAVMMQKVAEYIERNPDSNFSSLIKEYGNQFVVVTTGAGLYDNTYDYSYYYEIVDCEPDDCVYLFVAGIYFPDPEFDPDGSDLEEICDELFTEISNNITIG